MSNILQYAIETYKEHISLISLFSIAFIIAFMIPIFAPLPTYSDAGGVFLRIQSLFINMNAFNTIIIIASAMLSLLFLSFAIVAITVVVKHKRTATKITKEVKNGLEHYTTKVFVILLLFTILFAFISITNYIFKISSLLSSLLILVLTPFFFYAPASIVIDDSRIVHSMNMSVRFFLKRFDYVLLWLVIALLLITIINFILIEVFSTLISIYLMFIINSIFILPFLVVLQDQAYMKRFALLKM
ncbi:MAG: hypothetical protein M1538_00890 [Candidatus Marsarchaeota archaeon]|nr:hypothetical protein [Candidatus Marsarchaeota archaeon]